MGRGLFDVDPPARDIPLAERMRPRTIAEVVGQKALAADAPFGLRVRAGRPPSCLLYGPPGCGKTTIARLVAGAAKAAFLPLSAVAAGVKEIRETVDEARALRSEGRATVVFVDEVHRFNKAQQDALLPHVEAGLFTFIGATTENPSFHVNAALLSRCVLVVLEALEGDVLTALGRNALVDADRGLGSFKIDVEDAALRALADRAQGDARRFLGGLENAVLSAATKSGGGRVLGVEEILRLSGEPGARGRSEDERYDLASALQKSIRGSDPQAAVYYLARMLEIGESPLYVARRLVRIATEDVGLADPRALTIALDAAEAYERLGSPEGEAALASAALYLAIATKSDAVNVAYEGARDDVRNGARHDPPDRIKNAPTKLSAELGRGAGYRSPHELPDGLSIEDHLPRELRGRVWYRPVDRGLESEIKKRMERRDARRDDTGGPSPPKKAEEST